MLQALLKLARYHQRRTDKHLEAREVDSRAKVSFRLPRSVLLIFSRSLDGKASALMIAMVQLVEGRFVFTKEFVSWKKIVQKATIANAWMNSEAEIVKFTASARTMGVAKMVPLVALKKKDLKSFAIVPLDTLEIFVKLVRLEWHIS